jgi:ribosomal protein S2
VKTEKISKHKNKFLKLKLIQTKTYIKKQYTNNITLEDIQYRLKKIFFIIYKYHIRDKKILFIGTPFRFSFKINNFLKNTKHIFIPDSIWIKGALNNKKPNFKYFFKHEKTSKDKISELLLKLKKNIDLVILFDELKNSDVLNESYIARIPIIALNSSLNIILHKPSYKIPGNFQFVSKKIRDNLFYSMLIATLKKGSTYKNTVNKALSLKASKSKVFNRHNKYEKFSRLQYKN